MRAGGEKRGNSVDRRRRKHWILKQARWDGDGESCRCVHCRHRVTYRTLEVDRIKPGGSYRHENIQPSCGDCNRARSNNPNWQSPVALLRRRVKSEMEVIRLRSDRVLCDAA